MSGEQDPDEFYSAFTERNRGLIPDDAQHALRNARILIAGCGSTGGAAVEPLARLGVQRFVLAEPGEYELNNLNRQSAGYAEIGRNKALAAADRIRSINPHAHVEVDTRGVQDDNIEGLLDGCALAVDGIDVTTAKGWQAKYALHVQAAGIGCPVVSGYDMSGTQYVRYYDYRGGLAPLAGQVTEDDIVSQSLWDLLLLVVPRELVPEDLIADVRKHRGEPEYSVPQLVYTSMLFGALAARFVVEVLAGTPVRDEVVVDLHTLVRATP